MTKPRGNDGAAASDDPLLFSFFNEIGTIEQLSRAQFERVLPHGLTLAQFKVLNHFARLGGEKTPVQLARAFQVTKGAMTNAIGKLEAKGYVEVAPDPRDGRSKRVVLTDAGLAARNDAIAALAPVFPAILGAIDEKEFAAAIPFLQRVRRFLDENRSMIASK